MNSDKNNMACSRE